MNYEKAYKQALGRANAKIETYYHLGNTSAAKSIEEIFPELRESEDERIRKELLNYCKAAAGGKAEILPNINFDKCIFWLEKQGEQKPADKIKTKFKVGNWVVQDNIGVYKIIEICKSWYEVIDTEDYHYSISFDNEHMCHLWTIQDAKDGDVLYSPCLNLLWIFKSRDTVYCGCNLNYNDGAFFGEGYFERPTNAIPTTKEQCDILFAKMKEAGYEWDAEKKELIKIEQNPIRPVWYNNMDDLIADAMIDEINESNMPESSKHNRIFWIKSHRQKHAWSEEDEWKRNELLQFLKEKGDYRSTWYSWLKSIKPCWKPSDEQVQALYEAILYLESNQSNYKGSGRILEQILDEIKTLRDYK